jgi:hypothetical protein
VTAGEGFRLGSVWLLGKREGTAGDLLTAEDAEEAEGLPAG